MQAREVVRDGVASDSVTLTYEDRHRRRIRLVTDSGVPFLLDLPEARVLRDGDRLKLEDGRLVLVRSAPEELLEIRAADVPALARLAWHLGNRHTPTQVAGDSLRIRPDHVLEHLLRDHLGAEVRAIRSAFEPEGGAYRPHDH